MPKETPLRRWLDQWGLSVEKLARLCDVSNNTIGLASRGVRRPSDDLKLRIYRATHAFETENGAKKPKGIHPVEWFGDDVLQLESKSPPAKPEPSKSSPGANYPGKRLTPAKTAPGKRKAK